MTFLKAFVQQWHKAELGHSLSLRLRDSEDIMQHFNGATDINTVTNLIAALVYSDGVPTWLKNEEKNFEQPLKNELVFKCLVISCQLLFVKASQRVNLNQAERLILTLSNAWVNQEYNDPSHHELKSLIKNIYNQVCAIDIESRRIVKNMR
ncbi:MULTISPECIES: hypothetical protein [Shewanella]|uniref:Uncharacterized protein n=1 Tax=Shewanella metallivivens TaxID=2872342 RepID=A0ABT5TNL2_9GAMM|nr:hypothetical protein [Shewanella metallivivens]MDD8060177.1 hypothetical protein [Shewanella metallivivens]